MKEWLRRTGNEDLDIQQLGNKRICSEHFLNTDFLVHGAGRKVVKKDSYPIAINDAILNESIDENTLNESINENVSNESIYENILNESINENISNESIYENILNESVDENILNESINEEILNESIDEIIHSNNVIDNSICNKTVNACVEECRNEVVNTDANDNVDYVNNSECNQNNLHDLDPPEFCTNRGMIQRSKRRMRIKLKNLEYLKTKSTKLINENAQLINENAKLRKKIKFYCKNFVDKKKD